MSPTTLDAFHPITNELLVNDEQVGKRVAKQARHQV